MGFLGEPCREMGPFLTQSALFRGTGKWEFFDPGNPLFPILGILAPVSWRTLSHIQDWRLESCDSKVAAEH